MNSDRIDYHDPVMATEALEFLQPKVGQTVIDCTIGGGGHALGLAKAIMPGGKLVGIDRDDDALAKAAERLSEFSDGVILDKGNFGDVADIAWKLGVDSADGILFDLGVSSYQLDMPERGFSFMHDAVLDMRMDRSQRQTAEQIVNSYSERRLAEIFHDYGEERWAKRIARLIVDRRIKNPIHTTGELVDVIRSAVKNAGKEKIHPATRVFQSLRIAVNDELESLRKGLNAAIDMLNPGGRVVVLSYHSLEDRIVKETFARRAGRCTCPTGLPICACGAKTEIKILTKRPVMATDSEVRTNPRARSAKLRAAEKI